jgi:hypothetical protein
VTTNELIRYFEKMSDAFGREIITAREHINALVLRTAQSGRSDLAEALYSIVPRTLRSEMIAWVNEVNQPSFRFKPFLFGQIDLDELGRRLQPEIVKLAGQFRTFLSTHFDTEWGTDRAVSLAVAMFESGTYDRLPILADVLEEAGCGDDAILAHCRNPNQVHVRGCWVVDRVLNRYDVTPG